MKRKNIALDTKRIKIPQRSKKSSDYIDYRKVRDHRHYTGKYIRVAQSICNLKLKVPNEITVVCHNESKYDFHLMVNSSVFGKIVKSIRHFLSQ